MRKSGAAVRVYGFVVSIEVEVDAPTTEEQIALRLADSVAWLDGTGHCRVENLGQIQTGEEET